MLHAIYMLGNQGNFRLLVVESQIANLTFGPFFGNNLCLTCPNGSCEFIVVFQWYKNFFNPLGFNPWNCFLKIRKSTRTPTPKVGAPLGVWRFIPSHFPTLSRTWNVTPGLPSWLAPSQAFALVVSPRLGLWHLLYIGSRSLLKHFFPFPWPINYDRTSRCNKSSTHSLPIWFWLKISFPFLEILMSHMATSHGPQTAQVNEEPFPKSYVDLTLT
jgi:hypothetical protein